MHHIRTVRKDVGEEECRRKKKKRKKRTRELSWTGKNWEGLVGTHLPAMSVEGEFVEAENDIFYGTFEVLVERPTLADLFLLSTTCPYTPLSNLSPVPYIHSLVHSSLPATTPPLLPMSRLFLI